MCWVRRNGWIALLVAAGISCLIYAFDLNSMVNTATLAVVALFCLAATLIGPRLHKTSSSRPWRLLAGAEVLFLVGIATRPWSEAQVGSRAALSDIFTICGYSLCIASLLLMMRSRGRLERYAVADGALVTLSAGALDLVVFALPAAAITDRPVWISLLSGLYPAFDIVFVFILLHMGFTTAGNLVSYRAIFGAALLLFAGDLWYAWIGLQGHRFGPALMELPYMGSYALIGVSAIHPSMTGMSSPMPRPVQAWSMRRLAILIPALGVPGLLVLFVDELSWPSRAVIAAVSCGTAGLLLARSLTAVRGYAGAQSVLRHQSMHDDLTGLPNRRQLAMVIRDRLATQQIDADPLWLIALDLDRFRLVNDSWGHRTGDLLLGEVGQCIKRILPQGVLLARTGGDEFAILHRCSQEEALELARRIRDELRESIEVDGMDFVVTASLGLACMGGRGDALELIRDADTAMGRAKSEGRDCWVVFGVDLRDRVRHRFEIELALRHALDRGQLRVVYQPIIDLGSERVLGCEALLRWKHPNLGTVPPSDFIPVAEETGLIVNIGAWVLGESVRCVAGWMHEGLVPEDFTLSVNVSTRQFVEGGLLATVSAVLQESHLPAQNLCLEITESSMIVQPDTAIAMLGELRSIGVDLSVDDFGTGYSSLSYLSRLPVTGVKLDKSFVDHLGDHESEDAIVRAVNALAGAFELKLIAEGVETTVQRDELRRLGVPMAQGWLWGRAVSDDVFRERFTRMTSEGVEEPLSKW